jgi:hypothetical protein
LVAASNWLRFWRGVVFSFEHSNEILQLGRRGSHSGVVHHNRENCNWHDPDGRELKLLYFTDLRDLLDHMHHDIRYHNNRKEKYIKLNGQILKEESHTETENKIGAYK